MYVATTTKPFLPTPRSSGGTASPQRAQPADPPASASAQAPAPPPEIPSPTPVRVSQPPDATAQPRAPVSGEGDAAGQSQSGAGEHSPRESAAPPPRAGLSEAEQQVVQQLKVRERQVHAHERAHMAAAGRYAQGGPSYSHQRGPDGRLYAVGGEVDIDTSKVPDDPQATLHKAEVLRRAALAPAEPSAQDRAIAAKARAMAIEARQELMEQRRNEEATGSPEALQRYAATANEDATTDPGEYVDLQA